MHTGLKFLGIAGVLFIGYKVMNSSNKKDLVNKIVAKYGDPKSPDYSANFDADPLKLNKLDMDLLNNLYSGAVR